jgi:hypothetical protein
MTQHGPYDGVLGFSQGANLAVLLAALKESGAFKNSTKELQFDFLILICGSAFGWEKQWPTAKDVLPKFDPLPLLAKPLTTKSMHFIGTADPFRSASDKLVTLFHKKDEEEDKDKGGGGGGGGGGETQSDPVVHAFTSGHKPPTQKTAAAALVEFLKLQF